MEKELLQNQLVIMKALLLLTIDPMLIKDLKNQIVFTETRIRCMI